MKIMSLIIMLLPSVLKIFILKKLGHNIGTNCYIGCSYLNINKIHLSDNCYIGSGNVFKNLNCLIMAKGSRINRWNQFTSNLKFEASLIIGENSSISLRHYFDICADITIGDNTIIAGHRSNFFTHSKGVEKIDYEAEINIGSLCYLGSNISIAPGTKIGSCCFVGMGAVVVGNKSDASYCLLAGNPAVCKKRYAVDLPYFKQDSINQPHVLQKEN